MKTRDSLLLCLILIGSLAFGTKSLAFVNWSSENQSGLAMDTTQSNVPVLQVRYHFLWNLFSDGNILDASGHQRHGTLMDGALIFGDSTGGCLNLGESGYVNMSQSVGSLIGSLSDFSISCWVNPNSLPMWGRIFDFGNNTENYMCLTTCNSNYVPRFAIRVNNGEEQWIDGIALPVGKWSHLAIVVHYDANLGTGTGLFYMDGQVVGINDHMTYKPFNLGLTQFNYLGKSMYQADPGLNANIADFRVYSGAISQAFINQGITQADSTHRYLNIVQSALQFKARNDTAGHVALESNTSWSIHSNQDWVHTQPAMGSNDGFVTVTVDDNPTRFARSARLTIEGVNAISKYVDITQQGDTSSQNSSYSVYVPSYGQLYAQVDEYTRNNLTSMKVSGFLDASDLSYLRYYFPKLIDVDLSETTIQWNVVPGSAFESWTNLVRMVLPENIHTINAWAFNECTSLRSVNMPRELTSIQSYAFNHCYSLTGDLDLPETLTTIEWAAFNASGYRVCRSRAVTAPNLGGYALGSILKAYIPVAGLQDYKQKWSGVGLFVIDSLRTVSVQLTAPGTLGDAILQQVDYVRDVNKLIVSGPLNSVDFDLIRTAMVNLCSIDLKHALATSIPYDQFSNNHILSEIILPDQLVTIGNNAFYNNTAIEKIQLPSNVYSIGNEGFRGCRLLSRVGMPASLTWLGSSAFSYCISLDSVVLPDQLTRIESSAFYECSNLRSIQLPQRLSWIGSYAFYQCRLNAVELPASIVWMDEGVFYGNLLRRVVLPPNMIRLSRYSFTDCPLDSIVLPPALQYVEEGALACPNLKVIRCGMATPPIMDRGDPFYNINKGACVLEVPHYALRPFKLAPVWNTISTIVSYTDTPKPMPVFGPLSLASNVRPLGQPDLSILRSGSAFVGGTAPLHTDRFAMYNNYRYYWSEYGYIGPGFPALVNESPDMTATEVKVQFDIDSNRWYYFSFPFQVKVSDIQFNNGALFSIRKYDGATRALNGTGGNWKNMTRDSVLKANTGYVVQCNTTALMTVPALDSTKNKIFTYSDQQIPLMDHPSTWTVNSSWNFVGNPFPSYFDTRFIDYTAPITIWNWDNWTYQAISLTDDRYALKPFESFFVQKPQDVAGIGFLAKGRLLNANLPDNVVLRTASANRTLVNLVLAAGSYSDKCRLVINPQADLTYETTCDASKFMSTLATVSQVYTLDADGSRYAINERPLGNGAIRLGFYAGTAGSHRLSVADLNWSSDWKVLLTDKYLNTVTDLRSTNYDFSSDKGTFDDRFVLNISALATNNESVQEAATEVLNVDGGLLVRAPAGAQVRIFTLNGTALSRFVTTNEALQIPLAKGLYLVRVDGKVFKSVVF